MEFIEIKHVLVVASGFVGLWLSIGVWKSQDPAFFKVLLTILAFVPVLGPLVVYWVSNFPSKLPSGSQARYPKQVNSFGRWENGDEESMRNKKT